MVDSMSLLMQVRPRIQFDFFRFEGYDQELKTQSQFCQ